MTSDKDIHRLIGRLESDVVTVKKSQDEMAEKIDLLIEMHHHRRGMLKASMFLIGSIGGIIGAFIKSLITT